MRSIPKNKPDADEQESIYDWNPNYVPEKMTYNQKLRMVEEH